MREIGTKKGLHRRQCPKDGGTLSSPFLRHASSVLRPNSLSLYLLDHLTFSHCVTELDGVVESSEGLVLNVSQFCYRSCSKIRPS